MVGTFLLQTTISSTGRGMNTEMAMTIRPETAADHDMIYEVHQRAFGRAEEADLVEQLRREARPNVSLVADVATEIVGHIFFSPVEIASNEAAASVLGLAPMAVVPERQGQGIGSSLVREGLRECRQQGVQAVVVLGHSEYYPRFGFRSAEEFGLRSEYDVPTEAFMAMELQKGSLQIAQGRVTYHPAFGAVE